jgi:hypothetical protein
MDGWYDVGPGVAADGLAEGEGEAEGNLQPRILGHELRIGLSGT